MANKERAHMVELLRLQADSLQSEADALPWWARDKRRTLETRACQIEGVADWIEDEADKRTRIWRESDFRRSMMTAFQPEGK